MSIKWKTQRNIVEMLRERKGFINETNQIFPPTCLECSILFHHHPSTFCHPMTCTCDHHHLLWDWTLVSISGWYLLQHTPLSSAPCFWGTKLMVSSPHICLSYQTMHNAWHIMCTQLILKSMKSKSGLWFTWGSFTKSFLWMNRREYEQKHGGILSKTTYSLTVWHI